MTTSPRDTKPVPSKGRLPSNIAVSIIATLGGIITALIAARGQLAEAKPNQRPRASLRVSVDEIAVPTTLAIDTSGSSDPDGDALKIEVYVDGQRLPGQDPIRTLATSKHGQVVILARASDGHSADTEERVVTVR